MEKGAPISLLCNASNTDSPPDAIDWFKDGNKLVHHKRFDLHIHKELSVASNTIISVLNIDHARMTDTGTYVCRTSGLLTTRYKVDVLNGKITFNILKVHVVLLIEIDKTRKCHKHISHIPIHGNEFENFGSIHNQTSDVCKA